MHFIDRLCLAWHSKEALAACMPAGMTHFTIFCFPQGLAAYCVTFVAQYWGAKRPEQIASVVWQGLYIGIAVAVLFTAYAVLTSTKLDIHGTGFKETILDLGKWNFTHHKYMLGVYSHLIVLVVGYAASFLFKAPLADKELTIWGYLEDQKQQDLR